MVQSRICAYYKHVCSHASLEPKTFLSLPEDVRHRVYLHAGFISAALIRVRVRDGFLFFCRENDDPPAALDVYFKLRLVSHVVNADAVRCLCSNNNILLDAADISGEPLAVLVGSPLGLLNRVRCLTIVLNCSRKAGCIKRHRTSDSCPYETRAYTSTSKRVQDFQSTWEKLINLLALAPNSSKLELKLICDVEDATTARLILKPLEHLRLARCSIRLSDRRNAMLEDIARSIVFRATSTNTATQGYFRFLSLPTELRQHILTFTDLITPFREIEWNPSSKFRLYDWYSRQYYPCSFNAFCSTQYSVFPACVCWRPPTPMFLVCRALLQDARSIFYASNRFIINPAYSPPQLFRTELFEASIFLTQIIPRDSLAHLSDLEILFPGTQYSSLGIERGILDDWERATQYVAPHLKKLTLSLYMGVANDPDPDVLYTKDLQASLKALCQVHEQIVRPLSNLRCFDAFFVQAWSPFNHIQWTMARVEQYFLKHEKHLETSVMGSGYNGVANGKTQRRISKWFSEMYKYA